MALTQAYLVTVKNLEAFLNAIRTAKAPERVNTKFLLDLEFSSSNDRLFIGLLKGLGFTDETGTPTQRYFDFLDQTRAGKVLADAIREAYDELFRINVNAEQMTLEEVKNKLRTLTRGEKSQRVYDMMANTFRALVDLADWSTTDTATPKDPGADDNHKPETAPSAAIIQPAVTPVVPQLPSPDPKSKQLQLHYNIQVHLPESRDPAVFDAIFQAIRRHLT